MADSLTARYEAAAPSWGRRLAKLGFLAAYRAIMDQALDRLPPPEGPVAAVDLGCGDGAFAEALANKLGPRLSLTLVDRSPAMLRAAEARLGPGRARLIAGDMAGLDMPPCSQDIVTAAHLLEHLPDPDAALAGMMHLLKPGGSLILMVSRPHWCSHLVWLNWRHRRFREAEMRDALRRAGFADLHCWQPPAGPPRRLSLAYVARRPLQAECAPSDRALTLASTS
ncbi:bifunctional 2-polyprenyl-6-hydroxyphenol methylase/3-demethylubiquinol 3-O-methyltransferase UbiG [Rhodobacter sp. SY28-1]|uniref:class I SAM-dependent methyltransferase n=1 Tax=Rhodobacter sp. SY28-1 TaxID=2562317 RepID=UPI0010BF873E|nr:class I SAM-dependent methyltransferase [Rhodobacter sp. SY28-1]